MLTYDACCKYVDDVVTVTEDEICAAILQLLEKEKVVAEGAGATGVAAVMFNKVPVKGKKVVCIVSGGNIDVTILSRVVRRGLAKGGRITTFNVVLDDKPGTLVSVASIISREGANITSVYHDRNNYIEKVNACVLRVICETRNEEHIGTIKKALENEGFVLV